MSGPPLRERDEIEADQWRSLRSLLAAVADSNAFYRDRLRHAGVHAADLTGIAEFCARVPFTTKAELVADQAAHPPYGSNLTFPLARYTRFHQTSGTTREPLRWLDTPESWTALLDCWDAVFAAAGVSHFHATHPAAPGGDRVFFAFSFGPFLGFWTAFEAAARRGCLCLPGGGMGSAARLRMILDNAATVLCCTPTYAARLAEVAAEEGLDLAARSRVRLILVAGEPGGSVPTVRRSLEAAWPGARVLDHHGMTEVGPVSYENPDRPGFLHVLESHYLAEAIDPATGAPAASGETGELVLTTLRRAGSPLLRYRTGDLVRLAAATPAELGRSDLALEGGVLGRVDDMVLVRGVNVYPAAVEQVLRGEPGVAEYRVELSHPGSLTQMRVVIEPRPEAAGDDALLARLEAAFRAALHLRVPVTRAEAALPRFEMKARRWVRVETSDEPLFRGP